MTTHRLSKLVASFSLLATLAGTSVALADGQRNPQAAFHHAGPRGFHGGGPGGLVMAALHENLGLTDAQRGTIEAIAKQNRPQPPTAESRAPLANAIRSGNFDAATLSAIGAGQAAHRAEAAQALAALHATLTPAQRSALVDAVTAKMANRPTGPRAEGPRPNHAPHQGNGVARPLGQMLSGLNLTPAQEKAIEEGLAKTRPAAPTEQQKAERRANRDAQQAAMTAKLQAFKGAQFDANAFAGPTFAATTRGNRGLDRLAVVVSVLDAAQREQLARRFEQGLAMRR